MIFLILLMLTKVYLLPKTFFLIFFKIDHIIFTTFHKEKNIKWQTKPFLCMFWTLFYIIQGKKRVLVALFSIYKFEAAFYVDFTTLVQYRHPQTEPGGNTVTSILFRVNLSSLLVSWQTAEGSRIEESRYTVNKSLFA